MAKILFISSVDYLPWGGSEELYADTAKALIKLGHEVTIHRKYWFPEPEKIKHLREEGCKISFHSRNLNGLYYKILNKLLALLGWNLSSRKISIISESQADLVCISEGLPGSGHEWTQACFDNGIPFVTVSHDNSEFVWPDDELAQKLIKICSNAKKLFFVSENNARLFERQVGYCFYQIHIIRNPFKGSPEPVPWRSGSELCFAMVGRIQPNKKGQDLAIATLAMQKWKDRQIKLRIYGGESSFSPAIKRLIKMHGISQVEFMGHVDSVWKIWKDNHILLMPSRNEGLPITLVEAMHAARPAIVTDVAGCTELIDDGENGFVAKAPTVDLLDEAMERAWEARDKLKDMGLSARQKVIAEIPENPARVFAEALLEVVEQ
jgi:glycosyltransferase involved in cell wall biosynthesis